MDPSTFPFTDEQLIKAGLLNGEVSHPERVTFVPLLLTIIPLHYSRTDVSEHAAQAVDTMKKHPRTLKLSLFALECINQQGHQGGGPGSPHSPTSPALSDQITSSHFPALSFTSEATVVSEHAPNMYERTTYYNGITGDGDHPKLVYRSDFHTTPFPKPAGRHAHIPVKSIHGVFDTPLNRVWDTVGPQIRDLNKAQKIKWSSIDPARFFTHGPPGGEEKGCLGPVVIWIGVIPSSTSPETAHDISQQILALLRTNGVEDAVVEWREAVPQKLAGSPLMRHVGTANATHHVRRFLTPLLGVPLATEGMEAEGTLTLWFHENKDKDGNPSDKVYGVSNCHVLRKDTTKTYERRGGRARSRVRVCGMRRFQRGLDDITNAIANHGLLAEYWTRDLAKVQAKEVQDSETAGETRQIRRKLDDEEEAIADLEALHGEATKYWSDIRLHRNIGLVQYAPAITVDEGGTRYTSDWGVFLAAEAKVKAEFEGNVVDLGSKYSPRELTEMFSPVAGCPTTFKFLPDERKLRIEGCATEEDLAVPAEFDSDGQRCLMVGKNGNTTDLTVGRYAGLVSFAVNEVGVESIELGIYNAGHKTTEVFSAKGDSGSLVWHMKEGKAHMVGQLHSGRNKGGASSNHITYCTPAWYLLAQIKEKFKYADFYRTTWEA